MMRLTFLTAGILGLVTYIGVNALGADHRTARKAGQEGERRHLCVQGLAVSSISKCSMPASALTV